MDFWRPLQSIMFFGNNGIEKPFFVILSEWRYETYFKLGKDYAKKMRTIYYIVYKVYNASIQIKAVSTY